MLEEVGSLTPIAKGRQTLLLIGTVMVRFLNEMFFIHCFAVVFGGKGEGESIVETDDCTFSRPLV